MKQIIVLAAIVLCGCGEAHTEMKNMARSVMKDPDSAKFGRFEQVNSKNRDWACLEINAKGPGGGYTGAQAARFVSPAGKEAWKFQGIAGMFDECVSMIHEMQPFEGGPR
ncbi:hypothetical protein HZY97_08450 [Sphingomonas sp. R-74633]|uniref:hypothetical protein n=1 Tax=Sphingomonas sp. R-74633 TaxID=2751188 RepID=UPI0015D2CDF4|nr:hypothetical protein [Sphingomonas sp. R-74633]NYT40783.1 hypothetical protein [Sphingomonas sp. R-74633]